MSLIKVYSTLDEANKKAMEYTKRNADLMNDAYDKRIENLEELDCSKGAQIEIMDPFGVFPRSGSDKEYLEGQIQNIGQGLELTWIFQITKDSRYRYSFNDGFTSEGPDHISSNYRSIRGLVDGVKERMTTFDRSILYGATANTFFFTSKENFYFTNDNKKHDKRVLWNNIRNSSKNLLRGQKLAFDEILESASKLYDIYSDVHLIGLLGEEIAEFERLYSVQNQ